MKAVRYLALFCSFAVPGFAFAQDGPTVTVPPIVVEQPIVLGTAPSPPPVAPECYVPPCLGLDPGEPDGVEGVGIGSPHQYDEGLEGVGNHALDFEGPGSAVEQF